VKVARVSKRSGKRVISMADTNFLLPDINQIRHSIRDIDDSYNNDWDLLAELCQNAVDAIRLCSDRAGKIELSVDAISKSISIYDNGIGIDPDEMPFLLKPFSTNKMSNDNTIGEKGVGLTYVMFSSNYFEVISGTEKGASKGIIKNAHNWKLRTDNTKLSLEHKKLDDPFSGTKVMLRDVAQIPLFNLTFEQLKYVLLTRTALGNTLSIWGNAVNIDILLKFKDQNGQEHEETLPYQYWVVYRDLADHEIIDLDDFVSYAEVAERSDLDKRRKLKDKIIYKKGKLIHERDNREINYVACFVPSRNTWNKLTVSSGLFTEQQLDNQEYLENFGYAKFQEGITVSVKGMPTGISIDHPSTGYAGYWSNIFILFEDRRIKFDIGRKSIHGMQARVYKEYARAIFNEFLKYVTKYVTGEVNVDVDWDKDETFAEIDKLINIGSDKIKFQKTPKDQEAGVAAIFYELIGKGVINQITPLISGYRSRYDLYAKWGHKKVVIDFKSRLRNVLRDFSDQTKMFDQLDCLVCWDVSEEDEQAFSDMAITLEPIIPNALVTEKRIFPHATHRLILTAYVDPIYVIDLKKVIASL
jgi:hypothetical protein